MYCEHEQMTWDATLVRDLRAVLRLGLEEDLEGKLDLTTAALVPDDAMGRGHIVARTSGVVAGMAAGAVLLEEANSAATWVPFVSDGDRVTAGKQLARLSGPARELLTLERTLLNVLSHLSGIATCTASFVGAIRGTRARIYDTRKTLPGWRRLQKYAVACGGGRNHRRGLDDAVLIKDNHLCFGLLAANCQPFGPADAVRRSREMVQGQRGTVAGESGIPIVEIEVDSLQQLEEVLAARPDIVLLDNMSPDQLRTAVKLRDANAPSVALEASGGIDLDTVRVVAETGVERISVGALTHSVTALDLACDWDTAAD